MKAWPGFGGTVEVKLMPEEEQKQTLRGAYGTEAKTEGRDPAGRCVIMGKVPTRSIIH